jgi:threonine dehydrogenase-like Zn-dependent dehydrogenase
VIETVGGTADTLQTAVAACRPGGTVCVLGVFTGLASVPGVLIVLKEVRILGSFVYNRAGGRADFEVALGLLRVHGPALGQTVLTHRFPLSEIDAAFRTAADKSTGSVKVTVVP